MAKTSLHTHTAVARLYLALARGFLVILFLKFYFSS